MAVQCHHGQLVRVFGEADAGNVPVGIHRNIQLAGYFGFYVESVDGYFGVGFTGFGILVSIFSGIFFVGRNMRGFTCKYREGIGRHLRLVEADKGDHFAVRAEFQGTIKREFFFIHPVGDTV